MDSSERVQVSQAFLDCKTYHIPSFRVPGFKEMLEYKRSSQRRLELEGEE